MRRTVYEPEHERFREVVREFIAREVAPHALAWDRAGIVDREVYRAAGKHGVIGFNVPAAFGGGGVSDFRFSAVLTEELARAGPGTPAFTSRSARSSTTGSCSPSWTPSWTSGRCTWTAAWRPSSRAS